VTISKEEADTVRDQDALLHGKTLFVIAARDAEDIALEFFANGLSGDFLRQFLVIEHATGKLESDGEIERSIELTISSHRQYRSFFVAQLRDLLGMEVMSTAKTMQDAKTH
jgi:hypothetical protein